ISKSETTDAELRKSCGAETKTKMTPKELLDTMLGYLGFVVEIAEMQSEGGNLTLQIYTEESRRLIGHDGEMLDAIQFLLNRLLQAKNRMRKKSLLIASITVLCVKTES